MKKLSLLVCSLLIVLSGGFSPAQTPNASADLTVIHQLLASPKPVIWLFTGDSITQGAEWTGGSRPFSEIFSERIRWELRRPRDLVINTAISGNKTTDLLNDFDWRVDLVRPNVVIIMFGMNDCRERKAGEAAFRDHLEEIVHRARSIGAIPVLQTTNTVLDRSRWNDIAAYNEITRQVAAKDNIILVDNWNYWLTHRTPEDLGQWMGNSIHPNDQGHAQIAGEIFRVLGISDPASPMVKLAVP